MELDRLRRRLEGAHDDRVLASVRSEHGKRIALRAVHERRDGFVERAILGNRHPLDLIGFMLEKVRLKPDTTYTEGPAEAGRYVHKGPAKAGPDVHDDKPPKCRQ